MNYEILSRKNKKYDTLNNNMKQLYFLHFDSFPLVARYKLIDGLDFKGVLDLIESEHPIRVLVDDRLFPYFSKVEGFKLNDPDFAACKGEWGRYHNIRFLFCHGFIKHSMAKIILYNERAALNKQIIFEMP